MRSLSRYLVVTLVLLVLAALPAAASPVTLYLNIPNSQLSGYSGNFATVTLTLSGGVVNVHVEATSPYLLMHSFGFNSDLSGLSISVATAGWGSTLDTNRNVDGFGKFAYWLSGPGGSTATSVLDFTISKDGGFSTLDGLLTANESGHLMAAGIWACGPNVIDPNACTGFATNGPPTQVPEPASMTLLAAGLLGLGGWWRRRH